MGLMGDRLRNQERKQTDDPEKGRQNTMNKKVRILVIVLAVLLAAGIGAAGFFAGKAAFFEKQRFFAYSKSAVV